MSNDYTPNSHKYKTDQKEPVTEKKVEKVINGTAKTKKKSDLQRAANGFFSEDVTNIKSYILTEVIIPAAKNLISSMVGGTADVFRDTVNTCLFGGAGARRMKTGERTPYRSFYGNEKDRNKSNIGSARTRSVYDYDDIILETKSEAEKVLDQLEDIIENYGMASVADLYQSAGIRNYPFTCNNYGWTDIRSADSVRLRDGSYMLKLPKALPLD